MLTMLKTYVLRKSDNRPVRVHKSPILWSILRSPASGTFPHNLSNGSNTIPFMGWWSLFQKRCPFLARRHAYVRFLDLRQRALAKSLFLLFSRPTPSPSLRLRSRVFFMLGQLTVPFKFTVSFFIVSCPMVLYSLQTCYFK